mmetsp:Transcript_31000/g.99053  ORF Transcript_31000/g.99053 Transcript_31000/m.99053 type:complete len:373 (-) Transcript_31000:267-1385(-)
MRKRHRRGGGRAAASRRWERDAGERGRASGGGGKRRRPGALRWGNGQMQQGGPDAIYLGVPRSNAEGLLSGRLAALVAAHTRRLPHPARPSPVRRRLRPHRSGGWFPGPLGLLAAADALVGLDRGGCGGRLPQVWMADLRHAGGIECLLLDECLGNLLQQRAVLRQRGAARGVCLVHQVGHLRVDLRLRLGRGGARGEGSVALLALPRHRPATQIVECESPLRNHAAGEGANLLQVVGASGGDAVSCEEELLGDCAAERNRHPMLEVAERVEASLDAVGLRGEESDSAAADAARHDGHLVQRVVPLAQQAHHRMPRLVHRNQPLARRRPAGRSWPEQTESEAVQGLVDLAVRDCGGVAAGGQDGGFVEQVGQ